MGQVRDERKWFVGPTAPGVGARSTDQPHEARTCRVRAGGSACVVLPLGRIRADLGAVDLQTLEPSSVPDKTLITIFVDLETGTVIVVTVRVAATPEKVGCESHHGHLCVLQGNLWQRTVTIALLSVITVPVAGVTDPDRPSVFDRRPVGPRIDGMVDVATRPIGGRVIPSNDRGEVLFTPSAGGVS